MSTDRSQKSFDATPARKAKARREGNVARSSELSGIVAFAAAAVAMFAVIPWLALSATTAIRALCARPDVGHPPAVLLSIAILSLLPACAAATGGFGSSLIQGGGFTIRMPAFQFKRLDPLAGFKRMVGAEAAIAAARAVIAFTVASATLWPLAIEIFGRATNAPSGVALGNLVELGAQRASVAAILVGACFAGADYAIMRRRWLRDLKMTLEEIRRDHKENDGDPQTRSRRKSFHRTIVRGSIARTKDASFVVVNPTHIAIAIRYSPPDIPVPEIVVRASDHGALRVKAVASAYGIPIVENVALARLLFADGRPGQAIPAQTFIAVARIIAELARAGALS